MMEADEFVQRWQSGGSEQANAQLFLTEFCDLLHLDHPDPAESINEKNGYCFERKIYAQQPDGRRRLLRMDLYRKGCFVLEAKQGISQFLKTSPDRQLSMPQVDQTKSSAVIRDTPNWCVLMDTAKRQAEHYVHAIPADEGRPPFVIVADIGYCFDLYSEFTCTGGIYTAFPDPQNRRIYLEQLRDPDVRQLFCDIWTHPLTLNPAIRAAQVTEEVARHLAELAQSLEESSGAPGKVSQFLMRCVFTMFAEDTGLLPRKCFTTILQRALQNPSWFATAMRDLWTAMNDGGYSLLLPEERILKFDSDLFANPEIPAMDAAQLGILLRAAEADWRKVEPAIFGTLLERALDPAERHRLGAHYTPRDYVARLITPTIINPLREEWQSVQATADDLHRENNDIDAMQMIADFHNRLLQIKVLDPACGSGNFLYVTMDHMQQLEAEVIRTLTETYHGQHPLHTIMPSQFLGLEKNPRAVPIAAMVLWIGWLQWYLRTHGAARPPQPVLRSFGNIRHQDALIAWKRCHPATDEHGEIIAHWDGKTTKIDPQTGQEIPDETAVVVDTIYEGVTQATWPDADFIVGNPPFIGEKRMRNTLGFGYIQALRATYANQVPNSCDYVMYWWHKAAILAQEGKIRRFGFITTYSIIKFFNNQVLAAHLQTETNPLSLVFAIPDHPWVDATDGATIRIAMTVAARGNFAGTLALVKKEHKTGERAFAVDLELHRGKINPNLTLGANVTYAQSLRANAKIAGAGVSLCGNGFVIQPDDAKKIGLNKIAGLKNFIRPYRNGSDILGKCRNLMIIDFFDLTEQEVKNQYLDAYTWLLQRVKPERDHNHQQKRRENWWILGDPARSLRPALADLNRYIATTRTVKHRFFLFLDGKILPDTGLVVIGSEDAWILGVLSSHIHICWALANGGHLGITPVYNLSRCFLPFPFPAVDGEQEEVIRGLGERLDMFRKEWQAADPGLTLTEMYNRVEALRAKRKSDPNAEADSDNIAELLQIHDELDSAVAAAYGWEADLPDAEILTRLVQLNAERVREEKQGKIRWLRPEYQNPEPQEAARSRKFAVPVPSPEPEVSEHAADKPEFVWSAERLEQTVITLQTIRYLKQTGQKITAGHIAGCIKNAPLARIRKLLQTFVTTAQIE